MRSMGRHWLKQRGKKHIIQFYSQIRVQFQLLTTSSNIMSCIYNTGDVTVGRS